MAGHSQFSNIKHRKEVQDAKRAKKFTKLRREVIVAARSSLPHEILITTANMTDRNGTLEIFSKNKAHLKKVNHILADGGYTGDNFANSGQDICTVEIAKGNKRHIFEVIPKRLVVERLFFG